MATQQHSTSPKDAGKAAPMLLRLYIAGNGPSSMRAIANLNAILRELPPARYHLEVIDALDDPLGAVRAGVFVTPLLMRVAPLPAVTVVGDLHDRQQTVQVLGLVKEER